MSIIPLDVQRRCERRWAARFSRPTKSESVAPRNQRPERESRQIAGPDKSKRKTHHRLEAARARERETELRGQSSSGGTA
jgi:hypothetical protein